MSDVTIKYLIQYDTEDNKEKHKYKKVEGPTPQDVKYEDGMYTFQFIKYYNVIIDGKEYYIIIEKDPNRYAFGMSEKLKNIITRAESGEKLKGYSKDLIEDYIKDKGEDYTFWISGRKVLMLDYYKNKIPATPTNPPTPDLQLDENQIINARIEWYIEYKKYGEDKWYVEPTYCSDKRFRPNPNIESYRFVKSAVYEINSTTYSNIIFRENTIYKNNHQVESTNPSIAEALDAAKSLIYGKDTSDEMFKGYTRIYPFNTEDSSSVFKIQEDKIKNKDVLTVTGSGDALLDLILYGADSITCFDINGMAKFYAILKITFIKSGMSYTEYKDFFLGNGSVILNKDIYDKYSCYLSDELKQFWDGIYEYLRVNNKQLLNSEHNMFYKIYDFFGSANQSYHNKCSYFNNQESYNKLQGILKNRSLSSISFIDSSLFDLPQVLSGRKYDYAYLSNILDFAELYFVNKDKADQKIAFKDFVLNNLANIIKEDGTIDVGFIASGWRDMTLDDYRLIFNSEEGFTIKDLYPYNKQDKVIVFKNRKLDLSEENKLL